MDRQIELWESLKHENVLRFMGTFTSWRAMNQIFLASEYASGGNARTFLGSDDNRRKYALELVHSFSL